MVRQALKRFIKHQGFDAAAVLSFSTFLALVPTLSLALSIFSLSPYFHSLKTDFELFLFFHLLPENYQIVERYLHQFVTQANQLTSISAIFLLISAIFLFYEIDKKINSIWQKEFNRPWFKGFAFYSFVLFLAPLLLSISLVLSSYLTLLKPYMDWFTTGNQSGVFINHTASFLVISLTFSIFYLVIPTAKVRYKDAFKAAVITAFLLEILKLLVSVYIKVFPAYKVIYGAFSVLPLFMLWIFALWSVILLGACFCCCFSNAQPYQSR